MIISGRKKLESRSSQLQAPNDTHFALHGPGPTAIMILYTTSNRIQYLTFLGTLQTKKGDWILNKRTKKAATSGFF